MKITYLPHIKEEQVQCWLETNDYEFNEVIAMIANSEMTFKELRQEILDNPEWDPTED
jgi:hypothetical protein